jgi:type I restriction enzyme S subunit
LKAIATIEKEYDGFIASTGFAVLSPKEIYFKFLSYVVLTNGFIDSVISLSKGVSYPSITSQDLLNISICIPNNIDEQKEISFQLDIKISELNNIVAKSQQEIELLKEYKTALISEVVTGKVDVREVVLN